MSAEPPVAASHNSQMSIFMYLSPFILPLTFPILAFIPHQAFCQNPKTEERDANEDVAALIDKLQYTREGDVGYMPFVSGSGFLPLRTADITVLLFGQERPAQSDAMCDIVKLGAIAVPQLITHLDDKRPTKLVVEHGGGLGGFFFEDGYDYNRRTSRKPFEPVNRLPLDPNQQPINHTVTVGDLCFVALGQIVNREFDAIRYQPTACIMVSSPAYSPRLREATEREWARLGPNGHKESLVRDFLEPDCESRRIGACLRLGYYFPETLEPLALKQLAQPLYDPDEVWTLVREGLYHSQNAEERRDLLTAFLDKGGKVAREAVLIQLFDDLELQEAEEDGRAESQFQGERLAARACLMDLFDYPKGVKSSERPYLLPANQFTQARFVEALVFFPNPRINRALRKILRTTTEIHLGEACARCLAGRCADGDIQMWIDACSAKVTAMATGSGMDRLVGEYMTAKLEEIKDRFGWTPLHVAAELGLPERIDCLIGQGMNVNARAANGQTPLHVATDRRALVAARILLKHKADPKVKDQSGRAALDYARQNGDQDLMRLLEQVQSTGNRDPGQ